MLLGNAACAPLATLSHFPFLRVPARYVPQRMAVFGEWWSTQRFDLAPGTLALTLADCDMI